MLGIGLEHRRTWFPGSRRIATPMCSVAAQHFHRRTRRRPHRAVMAGTPVVEQAEEAAAYPVAPSCLSCGLWMKNNCNCVNALALMPWAGSDRALTSWLSRSRRPYPRHTLSVTFLRPPAPHPHPTEYAHNDALGVFRFFATLPFPLGDQNQIRNASAPALVAGMQRDGYDCHQVGRFSHTRLRCSCATAKLAVVNR